MTTTTQADRFLKIVGWAGNRYAKDGMIVQTVGGIPTRFRVIEDLAAARYLGCPPHFPNHNLLTAIGA